MYIYIHLSIYLYICIYQRATKGFPAWNGPRVRCLMLRTSLLSLRTLELRRSKGHQSYMAFIYYCLMRAPKNLSKRKHACLLTLSLSFSSYFFRSCSLSISLSLSLFSLTLFPSLSLSHASPFHTPFTPLTHRSHRATSSYMGTSLIRTPLL